MGCCGKKQPPEALENAALEAQYQCLVLTEPGRDRIPIHHWKSETNSHFYAADPADSLHLKSTGAGAFAKDGTAWYIYSKRQDDVQTLPLVRWYDPIGGVYRYTVSEAGLLPPAPECKREALMHPSKTEAAPSPPGQIGFPDPVLIPTIFFTFEPAFSDEEWHQILAGHERAYERAGDCSRLTPDQQSQVPRLYFERIYHYVSSDPTMNAGTLAGSRYIVVNTANLLPLSKDEVPQTILHEMMHCVGYRNPVRKASDVPFDEGEYYGSVPLQAEICIAGSQSLTGPAQNRPCPVE